MADTQNNKNNLSDTINARSSGKYLSKNKHAGWLFVNAGPLIAVMVVIFTFALWAMMIIGITKNVNENILFALVSGLNMALGYILSYYFGSSKKDEPDTLLADSSINSPIKNELGTESVPSPMDLLEMDTDTKDKK